MRILYVPTTGDITSIDTHDYPSAADAITAAVGGTPEATTFEDFHATMPNHILYFNAAGKRDGLPLNERATWTATGLFDDINQVVGNVVICGPADTNGDPTEFDMSIDPCIELIHPIG